MTAWRVDELFRAFIAVAHQFESEHAASRVDVDPVPVGKQTSTLRADTPIDHVANDLPIAQSALDAIVRRPLPQDLPGAGIHGMNHPVDGLESSMIVEDGESIGTHVGWRIH